MCSEVTCQRKGLGKLSFANVAQETTISVSSAHVTSQCGCKPELGTAFRTVVTLSRCVMFRLIGKCDTDWNDICHDKRDYFSSSLPNVQRHSHLYKLHNMYSVGQKSSPPHLKTFCDIFATGEPV